VQTIAERFEAEISKSLRLQKPDCPETSAHTLVLKFLERIPEVRALLRTDVEAAFQGDPAASTMDEIILAYPYVEAMAIQRMAHVLYQLGLPLIPRIMTEWAHSRTGIDIHPGADIGPYFFIDHGTGVVIGETAEIGQHVKLYQGVALIARSLSGGQALRGKKRHPTVEDRVTIYAGSTIIGGDIVIGAGSTIGANVSVTHSIPARSLVYHEARQLTILDKDKRTGSTDDWMI
jgi:serine O-acetyltransferase